MRPVGRPRKPGKLRDHFAGQLARVMARRGLSRSDVLARIPTIGPVGLQAWLEGKRRPRRIMEVLAVLDR